eukprot:CAMPEP_0181296552 /NCGR_PEP_ID=MMETSP1101-20121128/4766_1 /TAXON_ID=46948 /ORGANISM="Rhodomonas abbreviata, Strain Caron Lab Isolate" /LENGTH=709 /DNA_ID=CAMNT_0023401427 /DNA_START=18 /DNA_END=2148 /DNA_ORIENTATION=+
MTVAGGIQAAAEAADQIRNQVRAQQSASGMLVGFRSAGSVVVLGCTAFSKEDATLQVAEWGKEIANVTKAIPCGLEIVGVFCGSSSADTLPSILSAIQKEQKSNGSMVAGLYDDVDDNVKWQSCDGTALSRESDTSVIPAKELLASMLLVRATSKVSISAKDTSEASAKLAAENSSFCVMQAEAVSEVISLPRDAARPCSDLLPAPEPSTATPSASKKGGKKGGGGGGGGGDAGQEGASKGENSEMLQLRQVWSLSCSSPAAPVLSLLPASSSSSSARCSISLDVLALLPAQTTVEEALTSLRRGGERQLAWLAATLTEGGGGGGGGTVVIRHFSVTPHQPFPISLAVPVPPSSSSSAVADPSEPSLLPLRSAAHRLFLLPLDRPFLRSPQALSFAASLQGGIQRLQNVHEGLPPSGVKGGTQHVVQGRYEYCHYMQDKFNDDGWGCMYRSYQTVLSWFRLQHYTSKSIQSHEEVQRLLVKMGDKPDRFIGSKQWIGAMEASMLLDEYLGVQCKVMNVASGSDLADKGRELAHHFDTQGTPIPIGGGVLAFTILGVDFNAETGHVKFLILDPHYTGSEDLGTIQNQGKRNGCSGIPSVGWHDATVFRADSFYNLALPQRPTAIRVEEDTHLQGAAEEEEACSVQSQRGMGVCVWGCQWSDGGGKAGQFEGKWVDARVPGGVCVHGVRVGPGNLNATFRPAPRSHSGCRA